MPRLELSVRNAAAVASNLSRYPERAKRAARRVVQDAGELTRELTQFFCPVDTGFMRDHVRTVYSPEGLVFEVGWAVGDFIESGLPFYPFFVEYGTVKMAAQPSLGPAYEEVRPQFVEDLRAALRQAARPARGSRGRAE